MTAPLFIATFDDDHAPARGQALVTAARDAGCPWTSIRVGADLGGLRATADACAATKTGLLVELTDTAGILGLAEACAPFGERPSVAALRGTLLVVVPGERAGKRLRLDAGWAPSALDLDGRHGFRRRFARLAPNLHRAQADCDDLVVPAGMFDEAQTGKLAATLRRRGARLLVSGARREDGATLAAAGVHAAIVLVR